MWVIFQIFFQLGRNQCFGCLLICCFSFCVTAFMTALSRVLTSRLPNSVHFRCWGCTRGVWILHILALEAAETVDISLKSLIYDALGCVAPAILPQCTFGVSHSPSGDTKSQHCDTLGVFVIRGSPGKSKMCCSEEWEGLNRLSDLSVKSVGCLSLGSTLTPPRAPHSPLPGLHTDFPWKLLLRLRWGSNEW